MAYLNKLGFSDSLLVNSNKNINHLGFYFTPAGNILLLPASKILLTLIDSIIIQHSGVGLLIFQSSLYPMVEKIMGPILVSQVSGVWPSNLTCDRNMIEKKLFIVAFFLNADHFNSSIDKLSLHSHAVRDHIIHSVKYCISIEECPICKWLNSTQFFSLVHLIFYFGECYVCMIIS